MPPLLSMQGISKTYPGVTALQHVSFSVAAGEVVGLIGENGAGKSTLMKVLGGVVAASAGAVVIDGLAHARLTVRQSQAAGVTCVHQDLNLFDNLDVAGNIFAGREARTRFGLLDRALMRDLADRGTGILMISSDLEEVIGVSDRIAVMCEGRIGGLLERPDFSEAAVLRLAVGLNAKDAA